MVTTDILTGEIVEEELSLTIEDLCNACHSESGQIVALVEAGIINPAGNTVRQWQFTGSNLQRARTALRLQRDLEINLAGAALALDLLDEIHELRRRLQQIDFD